MSGGDGFLRGNVPGAPRGSTEIRGNSEASIGVGAQKRGDKNTGCDQKIAGKIYGNSPGNVTDFLLHGNRRLVSAGPGSRIRKLVARCWAGGQGDRTRAGEE